MPPINDIRNDVYGIPEENLFPITTEKQVCQAIQFFSLCPKLKQVDLSKAINQRIKELGMNVKVSTDNEFYKHFNRDLMLKSFSGTSYYVDNGTGYGDIDRIIDEIKRLTGVTLNTIYKSLITFPSLDALEEFDKKVTDYVSRNIPRHHDYGFNPVSIFNKLIYKSYQRILDYISYNTAMDFTNTLLLYSVIEDVGGLLSEDLENFNDGGVYTRLDNLKAIMKMYPSTHYLILRKVIEFEFDASVFHRHQTKTSLTTEDEKEKQIKKLSRILSHIKEFFVYYEKHHDPVTCSPDCDIDYIAQLLIDNQVSGGQAEQFLERIKNETENDLNIIKVSNDIRAADPSTSNFDFLMSQLDLKGSPIYTILLDLQRKIQERNVTWIDRSLTTKIDGKDLVVLNNSGFYTIPFNGRDVDGETIFFGVSKDSLYLITKEEKNEGVYYLITLVEDGQAVDYIHNLYCDAEDFKKDVLYNAIRITTREREDKENQEILTEGLSFDKHGSLRFSFKPKKSLMDEYAEIHKTLIENFKSKNYEGMKTDLAMHFTLVNYIERHILHNPKKKITEEKKEDATKARMFAINDFKTYMRELLKVEPKFNFTEYYEKGDFGKITFNLTHDDIRGIKKLFHLLMFG